MNISDEKANYTKSQGYVYIGPHDSSKAKVWRAISRAATEFSLKHMEANK